MKYPPAVPHLRQALEHAKAGNAQMAMHHIGHAMLHLRGVAKPSTGGASGVVKLPSTNSAPVPDMQNGGSPQMASDAGNPITQDPNNQAPSNPLAQALRSRLAGIGR